MRNAFLCDKSKSESFVLWAQDIKSHQQIMVYNTLLQYLGGHDQLYVHM